MLFIRGQDKRSAPGGSKVFKGRQGDISMAGLRRSPVFQAWGGSHDRARYI